MTVLTTNDKVTLNGNGVATSFSFSPITIFSEEHLQVVKVNTSGVETLLIKGAGETNYSVTLTTPLLLPSTGSITYPASGTANILLTGEKIVIKRMVPLTQEVNLENQGGYFADTQENIVDKLSMIDIQQQEEINRSVKLNISTNGVSTELPIPNAGKVLGWNNDASGIGNLDLITTVDSTTLVVVSATQPALVDGRIWVDTSVAGSRIIKICDGSDYNEVIRFDTSTGNLTFTKPVTDNDVHTITRSGTNSLDLVSTSTSVNTGPILRLDRNKTGVTNDELGEIRWQSDSSTGVERTAGNIQMTVVDPTNTSEDYKYDLKTTIAGTLATRASLGNGLFTPGVTGGDKGLGTINVSDGYFVQNVPVPRNSYATKAANYTVVSSDNGGTIKWTSSGFTANLDPAATVGAGFRVTLWNGASGGTTATINIDPNGSETLDGLTVRQLRPGDRVTIQSDGSNWFTVHGIYSFKEENITLTLNSSTIISSPFGMKPTDMHVVLVNKTAELGYTAGDEAWPSPAPGANAGGTTWGMQPIFDVSSNDIAYHVPNTVIGVINRSTNALATITTANWEVAFRAYVRY
jgi:hypothetical protein